MELLTFQNKVDPPFLFLSFPTFCIVIGDKSKKNYDNLDSSDRLDNGHNSLTFEWHWKNWTESYTS